MTPLLVALGAALGAPLRFLLDLWIQRLHRTVFPWGTFTVNVVGSAVLGAMAAVVRLHGAPTWLLTLVGTGLCGALTTFSTFSFETVRLLEDRHWAAGVAYAVTSLAVGLGACASGWWVVSSL